MKALLLIFVFYVGGGLDSGASTHTRSVPYPTMEGCKAAAAEVQKVRPPQNAAIGAMCVEYR